MIRRVLLAALALTLGGSLGSVSAVADPRQDMLAGISRCAGLPDDRTFLDCVYGAAQPLRAALGLPPAPTFQIRLVPPAPGRVPAPMASAPPPARTASVPPASNTNGLFGNLFGGIGTDLRRPPIASIRAGFSPSP